MKKETEGTIWVIGYFTFVVGFLILVGGWDNFCLALRNIGKMMLMLMGMGR